MSAKGKGGRTTDNDGDNDIYKATHYYKMPQSIQTNNNTSSFSRTRFVLRNAWNTNLETAKERYGIICTPFRATNNAGDLLSRKNYSCGGSCQTPQSRPNLHGLKGRFGSIQNICDETFVPPSACNVKYVYDSSDYSRYLRQRAMNINYYDSTYGGDDYNATQSPFRAIHRY